MPDGTTENDDSNDILALENKTPNQVTVEFQADINELNESPVELADRMSMLGDYRPYNTILRGVQRMLSGETRVSGEMKVLVTMMMRQQRRLKLRYSNLSWNQLPDGSWSTQANDFRVTLVPQKRGRWLVNVVHKDGYSHPWPRWQDNLESSKKQALVTVEDATDYLLEQDALEHRLKHANQYDDRPVM
jgi:hypothetical protein